MQQKIGSDQKDRAQDGSKSNDDITVLSGEGNTQEKNLRDRASGLSLEGDDTEIEAW